MEAIAGSPGDPAQRLRLLFAAYMAGGNATILANLKEASEERPHATSWAPIDLDAESKRYKHGMSGPRALVPGTFRNSMITARFIREMERDGPPFDAAWFFQQTICMFLWRFRRRVPHVVAMDGTPLWYARHGLWYAQFRFDPSALREKIKYLLTRQVYQQAFHLLPLSTGVRDSLVEDYGVPPERITVVPPGVNVRRFTCPDRGTPERLNRRPQILFVGADYERKGGDLVNDLADRPEFRDVTFHVVTRSYRGRPPPANVHVHSNLAINTSEIVDLFAECDVFLLPTRQDAHSVASIEAMAMGMPVITTPTGGIVDIVDEGKTGYFVPRDDLGATAERLRCLLDDPALRLRMGAAARRRVEERFDNAVITGTVMDVLERAAATRPRRGAPLRRRASA